MPSVTRRAGSARAERRAGIEGALLTAVERRTVAGAAFGEITVDEIAADVGISRSKFYVYFARKSDLLRSWYARFDATLTTATAGWWETAGPVTRPALRDAVARLFAAHRAHAALLLAVHELAAAEPDVREQLDASFARTEVRVLHLIDAGQRGGWVNPALGAPETAMWLTSMIERGLTEIVGTAEPHEVGAIADACTDVLWLTLYAPAQRPA